VEDIDFWMDFVVKNSNKLQKLSLEGKIGWAFNVFTVGPTTHGTLILLLNIAQFEIWVWLGSNQVLRKILYFS
jgi:hypothetical protein